jgi:Ca2+-transporting ATPase
MAVARVITNNHDLEANPDVLHAHASDVAPSVSTLRLFRIGLLCNDAHIENEDASFEHRVITGNPTERALVLAAHAVGFTRQALEKEEPRLESLPFDSNRKYMLTIHRSKLGAVLYCKGAPEILIGASKTIDVDGKVQSMEAKRTNELLRRAEQLSREGLRVLAFAYAKLSSDDLPEGQLPPLTFVGLVGLKDPLRSESAPAIARLQQSGIRVAMITGDHKLTAEAIARELGIHTGRKQIVTGREIALMDDEELQRRVEEISVYARVTAQDKIRIVKAWKARGEVVAMTGDGINDAAALKAADIGVALGSGTDVAKEASRLILLDDNVKTIAAAVEEGRIIFENVRKVTLYLLSDSFSAVLLVALSLIGGLPLALTAAQILWINLVADGLPNIALTVEPKERDVMKEQPRLRSEPLVDRAGRNLIAFVSLFMGSFAFFVFVLVERQSGDAVLAQSVTFFALGATTLLYAFSLRNTVGTIFSSNPFRNPWLVLAVGGGLILQFLAITWGPLQSILGTTNRIWEYWPLTAMMVIFVLAFVEATKTLLQPNRHHRTR